MLKGIQRLFQTAILSLLFVVPVSAAEIQVPAGGDLQAAINAAQPGDVITIAPSSKFVGNYKFPAKMGVVTLTTRGVLPMRRMEPADASLLATISSPNSLPAMDFTNSHNWVVTGIRNLGNPGGYDDVIVIDNGTNIKLNRMLIDLPEPQQQKRYIRGNGTFIEFSDSYCGGVWRLGQDSQCFAAWNGAGPYFISNNYLEAAGENVLIGGDSASSEANIPSDILIEHNFFTKRLLWQTTKPRQVKNLLELKNAKRVIIRQNEFEHNWWDAQSGWSILFTPRNQNGDNPWTVIDNVLFEENVLRNVDMGINITGYDDLAISEQTTNIVIRNNNIQTRGKVFLVQTNVGNLSIYQNTITAPDGNVLMSLDRGGKAYAADFLIFAENAAPGLWIHSPTASGEEAIKAYTRDYSLTLVTGTPLPPHPPENVELLLLKARVEALEAKLQAALDYLARTPTATKIMQVVQTLRNIPR